jgi:hypothetical protein
VPRTRALTSKVVRTFDDSESLAAAVAADEAGIGFCGLAQVGATRALAIHEGTSGSEVKRLGFADNQGGDRVNVELSRQRAQAIATQLMPRGIRAEAVVGLGSALPVAPNDTPDGRNRNRRVEIWVR